MDRTATYAPGSKPLPGQNPGFGKSPTQKPAGQSGVGNSSTLNQSYNNPATYSSGGLGKLQRPVGLNRSNKLIGNDGSRGNKPMLDQIYSSKHDYGRGGSVDKYAPPGSNLPGPDERGH